MMAGRLKFYLACWSLGWVSALHGNWMQIIDKIGVDAEVNWSTFRWNEWELTAGELFFISELKIKNHAAVLLLNIPLREISVFKAGRNDCLELIDGDLTLVWDAKTGFQSKGIQTLHISRIKLADFEATEMSLGIQLNPEKEIAVTELSFNYAGGRIKLAPFIWKPTVKSLYLDLLLDGLDMQKLTNLLPDWGFSAEGRIDGRIGLIIGAEQFDLTPGSMHYRTNTNGSIRYKNEGWLTRNRDLHAQAKVLRAAEEAITDLKLQQLNLTIHELDASGGPQAVLEIIGESTNLDLNINVPVNLQINFRFALADIASLSIFQTLKELLFTSNPSGKN
jgi:hypothetical protein